VRRAVAAGWISPRRGAAQRAGERKFGVAINVRSAFTALVYLDTDQDDVYGLPLT